MSSVLKLVEYISHDVDCMDGRGLTPLMLAVRTGNVELASFLLMLGANVLRRYRRYFIGSSCKGKMSYDLLIE
jgi:ankyrin repeat protein